MSATIAQAVPAKKKDRFHRGVARWVVLAVVGVLALFMVAPFVLMVMNAFKSPADYSGGSPLSLPTSFYTDGLAYFWERVNFPVKLWNSIWTSALVAVAGAFLSLFNAYAIGVGRVKGRAWIIALFMIANMLPQEGLIYPLFMMAQKVGLTDNPWSIVIIFTVIQSAFGTYLLSSVLGTFPRALLEAAELDQPLGDSVEGRLPDRAPHDERAHDLLLHLDLERVLHPAGHAHLQRHPDGADRAVQPPGRPHA